MSGPNGPKVIETGDVPVETILDALPAGWTVHPEDWANAVNLGGDRRAYPLSQTWTSEPTGLGYQHWTGASVKRGASDARRWVGRTVDGHECGFPSLAAAKAFAAGGGE